MSPESVGDSLLAWALNESATEYEGEGYERVMLHSGLGVAYRAKPVVAEEAHAGITHGDLTALLYLQGYARSEFVDRG